MSSQKKISRLNSRQRATLEGIAEGKTMEQAALAAGYSVSTARRGLAGIARTPATVEIFHEIIRQVFCVEEFAARIRAGCEAMETRLVPSGCVRIRTIRTDGTVVMQEKHGPPQRVEVIAWRERRRYLELWARLAGYMDGAAAVPTGETELDRQIMRLWEAGPVLRDGGPVN